MGNTDDHARNHSAFWDGEALSLTPAYDVSPQLRSGTEANQAMAVGRGGQRQSRLDVCRAACETYLLDRTEADELIQHQLTVVREEWDDAADAARLSAAERDRLWGRQVLNPWSLGED